MLRKITPHGNRNNAVAGNVSISQRLWNDTTISRFRIILIRAEADPAQKVRHSAWWNGECLGHGASECQFITRIIERNRTALFGERVMRGCVACVSIIDASSCLLEWQNRRLAHCYRRIFRDQSNGTYAIPRKSCHAIYGPLHSREVALR